MRKAIITLKTNKRIENFESPKYISAGLVPLSQKSGRSLRLTALILM